MVFLLASTTGYRRETLLPTACLSSGLALSIKTMLSKVHSAAQSAQVGVETWSKEFRKH